MRLMRFDLAAFARLALLFAALFAFAQAHAATLDEATFARHYAQRLAEQVKGARAEVKGRLELHATLPEKKELTIFLDNAYAQYRNDPAALEAILRSHIATVANMNAQQEALVAASSVFAVVKPVEYVAQVARLPAPANAGTKAKPLEVIHDRINDDLVAVYVVDTETGMRSLTPENLAALKLDRAALRKTALQNLGTYFAKTGVNIQRLKDTGAARVYVATVDENYDASILLLDQYWAPGKFDVAGEPVVFVPARNAVIVTGSKDEAGLAFARRVAARAHAGMAYSISPKGFVRSGNGWREFK